MKVGFILECTPQGPDAAIYTYLAKHFCNDLEILKPETLSSKAGVMEQGADVAKTLLDTGCDYVFIIWDRMPKWGGTGRCEDHIATLENSLQQVGADRAKIFLCCISDMLESWLIADGRGIDAWIASKTNHPMPGFGDHKTPATQTSPKERIKSYLQQNFPKWKYKDFENNFDILKHIPEFSRVANWNDSFRFFKERVEAICP
ncbi:MAG: hypothetical protein ACK51D_05710 [Cyclobacteriaceae bacterium]|jgi:hypothetical protein